MNDTPQFADRTVCSLAVGLLATLAPVAHADPSVAAVPADGGSYAVVYKHSGKCQDVRGADTAWGADVIQWPCHGGDNQRLRLEGVGNGYHRLIYQHSGQCADVFGADASAGAKVIQWPCHGGDNQLFTLEDKGGGYYSLRYRHSGQCLDVYGAATTDAAHVIQWPCHGGDNQLFLMPGSEPQPATPQVETRSLAIGEGVYPNVPLGNGSGVAVADVPVTVHSEGATLYAVRWGEVPAKVVLSQQTGGATLAGRGQRLLVLYVHLGSGEMRARESLDGGQTWGTSVTLGSAPAGPALPSACFWQEGTTLKAAAVWSNQPDQTQGPLMAAIHDGSGWRSAYSSPLSTSGIATFCPDGGPPEVIWRDHRAGTSGTGVALYQATLAADGSVTGERKLVQPAYDPGVCGAGAMRLVGYHSGTNDAHLGRSTSGWDALAEVDFDAETTATQPLDETGKYVNVGCDNQTVAVTWGDWPTKAEADAKATSRRLGFKVSRDGGLTWQALAPAGEDQDQGPATIAVSGGTVHAVWRAPGAVRLTRIQWP